LSNIYKYISELSDVSLKIQTVAVSGTIRTKQMTRTQFVGLPSLSLYTI